jgi:hypothetical protein
MAIDIVAWEGYESSARRGSRLGERASKEAAMKICLHALYGVLQIDR